LALSSARVLERDRRDVGRVRIRDERRREVAAAERIDHRRRQILRAQRREERLGRIGVGLLEIGVALRHHGAVLLDDRGVDAGGHRVAVTAGDDPVIQLRVGGEVSRIVRTSDSARCRDHRGDQRRDCEEHGPRIFHTLCGSTTRLIG